MVRNEVKGAGLQDTRENCWRFFIDRVRRQLKVILCFSPVGKTLRVRGRKFPALINCTCIDWFHEVSRFFNVFPYNICATSKKRLLLDYFFTILF